MSGEPREYRVKWEIDIFNATSPLDAARKACEIMLDPGSMLPMLEVEGEVFDMQEIAKQGEGA